MKLDTIIPKQEDTPIF